MRTLFTTVTSLALELSLCFGAAAQEPQNAKLNREEGGQQRASGQQQGAPDVGQRLTVRGKVVGVTVIGEAVIDPSTKQAIVAQVNYLTVLGSPVNGQRQVADGVNQRRDNVYIVAMTPRTSVRAGEGGRQAQQAGAMKFDKLEIGDNVEVVLTHTGEMSQQKRGSATQPTGNQPVATATSQAPADQHGRDRVYIGEADSITILSNDGARQG